MISLPAAARSCYAAPPDCLRNRQPCTSQTASAIAGKNAVSAQIDVGRTVIRRAERRAADLKQKGLLNSAEIHQYLNRLADMLFTLARYAEEKG